MASTTRTESIQTAEGEQFDGTAVIPDGGGPGILLLQEIFGVGGFMLAKANDLAPVRAMSSAALTSSGEWSAA